MKSEIRSVESEEDGEKNREKKKKQMNIEEEDEESKVTEETERWKKHSSKLGCEEEEVQKLNYVHVRARRGQATDSHSLAERVRIIFFLLHQQYNF